MKKAEPPKKSRTAITVREMEKVSIQAVAPTANHVFTAIAQMLSDDLAPQEVATIFQQLKDWEKVLADLNKNCRARILERVQAEGRVTTDNGSKQLVVNGWVLEARRNGGKVQGAKVEALLRAKSIDPAKWMDQEVSYSLNEGKLQLAVDKKVLSTDELKTCESAESWAVQTPKRQE